MLWIQISLLNSVLVAQSVKWRNLSRLFVISVSTCCSSPVCSVEICYKIKNLQSCRIIHLITLLWTFDMLESRLELFRALCTEEMLFHFSFEFETI